MRLQLALAIAGICVLTVIWLNELAFNRTVEVTSSIRAALQVRTTTTTLVHNLVEAESSQRGYILTGDRSYLQPYEKSLTAIDTALNELSKFAPGTVVHSEAMGTFKNLLSQKLGELALTIRMRDQDRPEVVSFVLNSHLGLEHMARLRGLADSLLTETDTAIDDKRAELTRLLNVSRFGLAAGAVAAFLAFFLYVSQTRALHESDARQQQALEDERDALEAQVSDRTSRLTELATHLQQAVEDERARLARELHDELGALLTAAKLDVARMKSRLPPESHEVLDRLKHLTDTLNQGIALKRRIIEDLRPSSLSNLGLVASLEILVREFGERSTLEMHTALEPVDLDETSELTIYRVVQEALTNIGKYARATRVTVMLKNYVYHAEVSISDDGVGFDPGVLPQASHGLVGMRHRVEASGGRLDIESGTGRGSRITATIPRRSAKAQNDLADSLDAMSSTSYNTSESAPTNPPVAG
ncbi:MAG: CHASE3 domain-containing protein [Proteobacteria bacterium]|nr:CHASE3 domain-containing protein [Pseudomonadota bacterium]